MEELIYDIGFHKGEDTLFYLLKGYNVVAVDADIELIEEGKSSFKEYIDNGRLILLNYAITNESDKDINFFISQNTLWNSTNGAVASRQGNKTLKKKVRSKRLDDLFREYGMPFYCKIDIEGNDIIALQTIENSDEKPPYISVETECLGENETIAMGKELETLERLYQLGYRRFKLVDQQTLTVLSKRDFYFNIPEHHWTAQTAIDCRYAKEQLELTSNQRGMKFTDFFPNASGPFGEELAGRWYGSKLAREILKKHRRDKMQLDEPEWTFWCDWHAAF